MTQIVRYSEASLPTVHGEFRIAVYQIAGEEAVALWRGQLEGQRGVLARVHSECFTGEVLGSLRCDCRGQLELALSRIAAAGQGVVVYLRQEGRGIGLGNKVAAYALQDAGRDTVEANVELGFAADLRSYEIAAAILGDLGVTAVRLMTNNPAKVEGLTKAGIQVVSQESHWSDSHETSESYLETKRSKMGHITASPPLSGKAG